MRISKLLLAITVISGLFLGGSPARAAVDAAICNKCYITTTQKCDIGGISNKVTINEGDFQGKCEQVSEAALKTNITECGKNTNPTSTQCQGNLSVFLSLYANTGSNAVPTTEVQKCAKELVQCASLLQACDGTLGQINVTNLDAQCQYYLQGVGGKWTEQLGAGLCAKVLGITKPLNAKCTDYKETINQMKDSCVCADKKTTKKIDDVGKTDATASQLCCQACTGSNFVYWKTKNYTCNIPKEIKVPGITKFENPLKSSISSPQEFLGNIIKTVLGMVGTIAFALVVYGGFMWMVSAGNAEKVKMGQQTIFWAAIGLVAIASSYAIVSFIIEKLG